MNRRPRADKRAEARDSELRIRRGTVRDVLAIVSLVRELAKYEKLSRYIRLDARRLRRAGFGRRRYFESLMCTRGRQVVGYAVYYFVYSTFSCEPVLFIEDIFVRPEERGQGAGKALMIELARIAAKRGSGQMEWLVLDWNTPSIRFYKHLGARLDESWILTRLTGARLRQLARGQLGRGPVGRGR